MLQVNLTLRRDRTPYVRGVAAGRHTTNTPADHIRKFYSGFSDIRHQKFDGFVVTGVNALSPRVEQETFWPEVSDILQWTTTHTFSVSLPVLGREGGPEVLPRHRQPQAASASCSACSSIAWISDKTGLLFGFPRHLLPRRTSVPLEEPEA